METEEECLASLPEPSTVDLVERLQQIEFENARQKERERALLDEWDAMREKEMQQAQTIQHLQVRACSCSIL
jgi:hypothetical protein